MLTKAISFLFLASLYTVTVVGQSAPPENDFQFWNETSFSKALTFAPDGKTERVSLKFGSVIRMFEEATRPGDTRLSIGLERRLSSHFSVGGSYVFRRASSVPGAWETEHRARVEGIFNFKVEELGIKNRSRVERLIREGKSDVTRFRQLIQLSHPIKAGGSDIFSVFGSGEVYVDLTAKRLSRDEYMAGISRKINPDFTIEPFIGLRRNRSTAFRNVGIMGINLKIKLH
jgi:hypothetical protein